MTHTRIAGGNYTMAPCGHPVRPGEPYIADDDARQIDCPVCGLQRLQHLIGLELWFLRRLAAPDD